MHGSGRAGREPDVEHPGCPGHGVAGKRHRLISHNAKYIRQNRGTEVLADADTARVKLWAPYGLK